MRNFTTALLLAAAAPLAAAQDFAAPVTLQTDGMLVGDVVAKLRAATHADLETTSQVAKEVVLVDVKGVAAKDLMAKLAVVLHGEWAKSDSVYTLLVRDTALRKAVTGRTAHDAALYKKALDDLVKRTNPDAPFVVPSSGPQIIAQPGTTQLFINGGSGTAGEKPLIKILEMISPSTLASISPGARVVFASSPFGVQLPLPGNADAQIHQALANELQAAEKGNNGRSEVVITPGKGDETIARLRKGVYGKAYLTIRRQGWSPELVATLTVVDPTGARLTSATTYINAEASEVDAASGGDSHQAQPAADRVVLSDEAKDLVHISAPRSATAVQGVFVIASKSSDGSFEVTNAQSDQHKAGKAAPTMLDPVAHEPLSYFVGEAVRQAMPADKAAVALLSDELFEDLRSVLASDSATVQTVKDRLEKDGYSFDVDGAIATAAPDDIDRCMRNRVDRKAFKRLLDASEALGVARLADLADYALVSPDTDKPLWDAVYASALRGNAFSQQVYQTRSTDREALRMYAQMPEAERRSNGRTNLVGALGAPKVRDEMSDLIFRSNDGPRPVTPRQQQPQRLAVSFTSNGPKGAPFDFTSFFGPQFERTDVFTDVPMQTALLLDGNETEVLRVYDPKTGQSQIMSPDQVGATRAMGEQPRGQSAGAELGQDKKVQILTERNVAFTLDFGGRYTMRRTLRDFGLEEGSKLLSWNELPLAIQDRITASYERSAKMYKEGNFGVRRDGQTPPP